MFEEPVVVLAADRREYLTHYVDHCLTGASFGLT